MELTKQQKDVLRKITSFLESSDKSVFILKGYAGTGKTTMIKAVVDSISEKQLLFLMAPTGRAARVLGKKTNVPAHTIHKSIYQRGCIKCVEVKDIAGVKFKFMFPIAGSDPSKQVVAIVDEASMVCSRKMEHELFQFGTDNIMNDLLTFVRPHSGGKVIFVGDPAQLPPVGEAKSNALDRTYFEDMGLEVVESELTEVLRQDNGSMILTNAMMIRDLLDGRQRNQFVFDEKEGEVESVLSKDFLDRYLDFRKRSGINNCVVVCYSNRSASHYNFDIRKELYGADVPIREGDILQIIHNNYLIGRMNGEFVPVLGISERKQIQAPVFVDVDGERTRKVISINMILIVIPGEKNEKKACWLVEDLLTSDKPNLSVDEQKALYINFCIRNPRLKQGTKAFADELLVDPYYNAIRAKYGYAVTGHKCQGGEWAAVFVDYSGRTGLSDDCLRWAYTATTRAQKTLYVSNLPHITPFSSFRIDPVQKCSKMPAECRVTADVATTPFHSEGSPNYLRAKYHCISEQMDGTPFSIVSLTSRPYNEIYNIQSPEGVGRFDIMYKEGGVFLPAKAFAKDDYTEQILLILNNERNYPYVFDYTPSTEIYTKLFNMIRSACDGLSVQLTNVVEHADYSVVFYFRTSDYCSYMKIYVNQNGFVSYAKPMTMCPDEDGELKALIFEIKNRLI